MKNFIALRSICDYRTDTVLNIILTDFSCPLAYEDEDQLLWRPDGLPQVKVTDFLREVTLLHTNGGKMEGDLDSGRVRDNEQVRSLRVMTGSQIAIIT